MLYGVRCTSSVCLGTPPSAGGEDTAAAAGGAAGSRPRSCDPLQRRAHHVPRLNAPGNMRHTVTLYSGAPLRRSAAVHSSAFWPPRLAGARVDSHAGSARRPQGVLEGVAVS